MASTIAAITTGVGGIVQTADASGNLSLLSGTTTVVAVTPAGAAVTGTLGASGAFSGTSGTFSTTLGVTGVATLGNGAILGVPASGLLTNVTGLPIDAGTVGVLPVLRGGSGVTTSTGTGNNVLSTSATLVAPVLGTPASGLLTNVTGLPIDAGTIGTLSVARGGSGVTTSTGTGNVVLSTSATLVAPALGTPASGNLANCTGYPAAALPAGSVLQVLSTRTTTAQTITGGFVAVSGLSVSITPRSASNKILVQVSISYGGNGNNDWNIGQLMLYRGATAIGNSGVTSTTAISAFDESKLWGPLSYTFLDSPATTSATAYTVQIAASYNGIRINTSNENTGASTITVTEIQG